MHALITSFSQFWGMIYALAVFMGALAYALWPANRQTFDRAARAPLETEDDDAGQG